MAKKIVVDEEKCIGCSTCAALAPKSFKMNDNNKSEVINPPAGGDDQKTIQAAIDSCPVAAISWQE